MSREAIMEKVVMIIRGILCDDSVTITEDSYFVDELEFGSLEVMEMMAELEDEFNLSIPEEKASQFVQVRDFIDYLEEAC